jgi:3-hydroxyisobutyrate dehydrogenase-like beta-hydroxyacid dehydrogenase
MPEPIAFVGFGALAEAFAAALRAAGAPDVRAYTRARRDPAAATALNGRLAAAGVRACATLDGAVAGAEVVVGAVPAAAARETAAACAPLLRAGCLYVDPSPQPPSVKSDLAALVGGAGADYVDVAVLGTVAMSGASVPLLAAGPGAERWAATVRPLGFVVTVVDGPAGSASQVKLLRSVYMKGRDALILEMVLAARRHGVEDAVVSSIGGPGEQVPFPDLVARVVTSLAVYAERRAVELDAAADLVSEAGVEPLVTRAGAARLRRLAALDLRERFGAERPEDMEEVLRAVEAHATARPGERGR